MRVSRAQAEENRNRIVGAAARLVRERGIASAGVDAITAAAGLTHGAFYSQFDSKDAVVAEAIRAALAASHATWARAAEGKTAAAALATIARGYLARSHRDAPGRGCVLAALGADVARQSRAVRRAFTGELERGIDLLGALAGDRDDALAVLSALVGALVLARAVDDEALSRRILKSTEARIGRFGGRRARDSKRGKGAAHGG